MAKKDTTVKNDEAQTDTTETKPTQSLFTQAKDAPKTAAAEESAKDEAETQEADAEASEDAVEAVAEKTPSLLDGMSVEDLRKQAEEINKALAEKTNAEKGAVIAQIIQVIGEYGITTEELVTALGGYKQKRNTAPVKIKYRDPATGNEWTGRGKAPLWIKDKDREQFLIKDEAPAEETAAA